MSELKATTVYDAYWKANSVGEGTGVLVYLKSEADKVIKDLIEKNKRLANKDIIMASEAIKEVYKELQHQKYKRCLAMAKWCVEKYENYSLLANEACQRGCYISEARHDRLADKWLSRKSRWLELADKFKEAK